MTMVSKQAVFEKLDVPCFHENLKCVMCGAQATYKAWRSYEPLCDKCLSVNDEAKEMYE